MPCFGMYIKYLRGFKGGIKSFMWEVGVGKFDQSWEVFYLFVPSVLH